MSLKEIKFTDFYESWYYLNEHLAFLTPEASRDIPLEKIKKEELQWLHVDFKSCLTIDVVKVNPEDNRISDDESKNTKIQIWLECGQKKFASTIEEEKRFVKDKDYVVPFHDPSLDCGGDTFEEAVIKLANLVSYHYTDNGEWIRERSIFFENEENKNE